MPDVATTPQRSWMEEELEPGHYYRVLRRHRVLVVAGAIVGAVAGLLVSSLRPVVYEGVTTVLIGRSNSTVATATSRALLENNTLAGQMLNEIGIPLSPQTFVSGSLNVEQVTGTNVMRVKVRLSDAEKAAQASRILSLKAVDLNRRIASEEGAAIQAQLKALLEQSAKRLTDAEQEYLHAQDQAQIEVLKKDTEKLVAARGDLVRLRIDIAAEKGRLAAAEQEIQKHERVLSVPRMVAAESALQHTADKAAANANAAQVLQEVADQSALLNEASPLTVEIPLAEVKTERTGDGKGDVVKEDAKRLRVDVAATNKARNKELDRRFAAESAAVDATHDAIARLASTGSDVDPQMLDLSHPFVNPVYQTLAFQIASSRTRLAALERQARETPAGKAGNGRFTEMTDLYRRTSELARLENNLDLARKIHDDLTLRYEQSRSQSVDSMVQLQIVDEATTPDRPVSRQRAQSTVLGFAVGLVSAVFLALARAGADRP